MKRFGIMAACCMVLSCTDAVDRAARDAYELTLRSPSDGSGYWIRRDASGRVATWQIRHERCHGRRYARWVQTRLTREFDTVVPTTGPGLLSKKTLAADEYMPELRTSIHRKAAT